MEDTTKIFELAVNYTNLIYRNIRVTDSLKDIDKYINTFNNTYNHLYQNRNRISE